MILVQSALAAELHSLRVQLDSPKIICSKPFEVVSGTLDGSGVVLASGAVGKVLASLLTQQVIHQFPVREILFVGVAGALNPRYAVGDIVLSTDCLQHDFDACALGFERGQIPYSPFHIFKADKRLLEKAQSYPASDLTIHCGRVLTGDQFVAHEDADHRFLLRETLKGDLVEMEGAGVALVAVINEIPFLLVRTISDRADGGAAVDFPAFLPQASERAAKLVRHIIRQ